MECPAQNQDNGVENVDDHKLKDDENSTLVESFSPTENATSSTNSVELKETFNSKRFENSNSVENNVDKIIPQKEINTETPTLSVFPANSSKKANKLPVVAENQERINYLFQASNYLNNVENGDKFKNLSASLGSMAMAIGRKCVLRLSPGLKRQLCKGCGSSILPAISSKYRLKKGRQKHLVVTCNKCKTIKRFVTNPEFVLWSDKPESNVD